MRILLTTHFFPLVSETFISLHCASLHRLGHQVDVLAELGDAELLRSLEASGDLPRNALRQIPPGSGSKLSQFFRLAVASAKDPRAIRLASTVLRDWVRKRTVGQAILPMRQRQAVNGFAEYDVVHAHFGSTALAAATLKSAGILRAPLVVTFHGTDLNKKRDLPNSTIYARVLKEADLVTVGTEHMASHFQQSGTAPKKVRVIPMGIDVAAFPYEERGSKRPIKLLTVGRHVEFKGTEYGIRAMAKLVEKGHDVVLDLVGDGPERPNLEKLAESLQIAGRVTFLGPLPHSQTLQAMQQADILVHPGVVASDGTREGQGVVLAEAQAMGLPVVASRVGGIPEAVKEGVTAVLVEQKDVEGLVRGIEALLEDPQKRVEMGRAGRRFVEQCFDQAVLSEQWVGLYKELMADGTGVSSRTR